VREDESAGDSEDGEDELSCVIGGEQYLTGLSKFGGEFIPKVRCSVLERAISDFQRESGWWTKNVRCDRVEHEHEVVESMA